MRKLLTAIGRFVVGLFCRVGRFGIFSWTLLMRLGGARLSHVVQQIHFIGNYSLLIIAVSGLFVGFVLGLQGYYVLVTYGSEQALGTMVALSLVRELGPAVTNRPRCSSRAGRARRSPLKSASCARASSSRPWR